ncbi:unnamed protein product [Somion occarium]|uniref:Ubiquitin 3 binding protein But2 C-terminal domain-containing protein n=1 Tax=Somion occarium TaxID=3059160 RepID=A0ABP1CS55_9APHY
MSFDSPTEERKSLLSPTSASDSDERLYRAPSKASGLSRFTLFSIVVCIICTGINLHAFTSSYKPRITHYQDLATLRRPNQWIGLDRVQSPPEHAPPILLYPNLLAQINSAEPTHVYKDDPVRIANLRALTPPEDRPFKVTPQFSTIAEFRSIDYKMENCEIVVDPAHRGAAAHEHSNFNATLGGGENVIDVWRLAAPYSIDSRTLSWKTRPSRAEKVATFQMQYGSKWSHKFSCPTDTLHVFEFGAANDETYVEWTQDHREPTPGVVMYQSSSFTD